MCEDVFFFPSLHWSSFRADHVGLPSGKGAAAMDSFFVRRARLPAFGGSAVLAGLGSALGAGEIVSGGCEEAFGHCSSGMMDGGMAFSLMMVASPSGP